jgi:hypothetical protein
MTYRIYMSYRTYTLLILLVSLLVRLRRQKERALTSPKTSALAFISVLPWRINDGQILLAWAVG